MTELKHTPGPWFIHDNLGFCVASIAKIRIASDVTPEKDIGPDARLIAAAPDLLEALDGMLQIYGGNKDWNGLKSSTELDCIEQARAAIAKATGEQP